MKNFRILQILRIKILKSKIKLLRSKKFSMMPSQTMPNWTYKTISILLSLTLEKTVRSKIRRSKSKMKSSQKVIIEISLQIQKMTILLSLIASTLLKLLLVYPISSEDVPNRKVVAPSRTIEEILNKSINKIVLKLWKTYQKISKLWSWSLHFPFLKILMKLQKTMYCQNQSPFLIFNNKLWKQSSFSMTLLAPKSKF